MAKNHEVKVTLFADPEPLKRGFGAAEHSSSKLSTALSKLGPVGTVLQGIIDKVGLSSVTSAVGIAGGITAALGVLAGVLVGATKKYIELADQVENFRRVSGASAEDSSRLVQVFKAVGIDADTAATAIFKFARSTAGGQGSLVDRLYAVADAYHASADGAERDKIVFEAFGKNGKALIPILEQGSVGLKAMAAAGHLVFTDADLERVKRMEIHARQAKNAWDEFLASLGGPITQALDDQAIKLAAVTYASQRYEQGLENGTIKARAYGPALGKLLEKFEQEYYAANKASEGLQLQADSEKRAAEQAQKLADELNGVISAEENLATGTIALARANLDIANSQIQIDASARKYDEAVKANGRNSAEAQTALNDYRLAILNQEQAYIDAGKAAKQLVVEQEKAAGVAPNVVAETQAEIDELDKMAQTLSPNSPLRKFLDDYIAKLRNGIPAEISTTLSVTDKSTARRVSSGHGAIASYDEGGTVPGVPGAPQVAIVHGGERISPPGRGGGGDTYNFQISGAQDPEEVARAVIRRMQRPHRV